MAGAFVNIADAPSLRRIRISRIAPGRCLHLLRVDAVPGAMLVTSQFVLRGVFRSGARMFIRPIQFRSFHLLLLTVFLACSATHSFGNDQQKADKQCRRITATTADPMARTIVSQSMADSLKVERVQLVRERHAMNLNYGSLFIAHQLAAAGSPMIEIANQLQSGKNMAEIAAAHHADWHAIADAAKRLNGKIEDDVYKHFLHAEADKPLVLADKYNPDLDVVKADSDVTPEEIAQARQIYVFWRDRAAPNKNANLDSAAQTTVGKSADIFKGGERPRQ